MIDLELQNKALNNKVRRLNYHIHILRGLPFESRRAWHSLNLVSAVKK